MRLIGLIIFFSIVTLGLGAIIKSNKECAESTTEKFDESTLSENFGYTEGHSEDNDQNSEDQPQSGCSGSSNNATDCSGSEITSNPDNNSDLSTSTIDSNPSEFSNTDTTCSCTESSSSTIVPTTSNPEKSNKESDCNEKHNSDSPESSGISDSSSSSDEHERRQGSKNKYSKHRGYKRHHRHHRHKKSFPDVPHDSFNNEPSYNPRQETPNSLPPENFYENYNQPFYFPPPFNRNQGPPNRQFLEPHRGPPNFFNHFPSFQDSQFQNTGPRNIYPFNEQSSNFNRGQFNSEQFPSRFNMRPGGFRNDNFGKFDHESGNGHQGHHNCNHFNAGRRF